MNDDVCAMVEYAQQVRSGERGVHDDGQAPGVGKEMVARVIHDNSSRAGAPFVVLNAATITPERMETELFGVENGNGQQGQVKRGIKRIDIRIEIEKTIGNIKQKNKKQLICPSRF